MKDGRNIVLWCFLACFIILNAVSLWFQHQNTQEMLRILDYQKMIMTLPHGIAEKDPRCRIGERCRKWTGPC